MPTLFFIGLFSFVMAMMSAVVMEISQSRQELTQKLVVETENYFTRIENFVSLDMIPNNLEILPRALSGMSSEAAGYAFLNQSAIKMLSPPNLGSDPLRDAWGLPLTVRMVTQNSAIDSFTIARLNGVFLHSAGADNISQTSLNGVPDTLVGYENVTPQGDDIVMFFTTIDPIRKIFARMYNDLNFIKGIVERDFNENYRIYRDQKIQSYSLDTTKPAPNFNQLAVSDPSFPAMIDVTNPLTRKRLGVDEVFSRLERPLPNRGRMNLAVITRNTLSVTFGLVNDPINPSPWPVLGPRVTANAILE